jgi:hypothetical protein
MRRADTLLPPRGERQWAVAVPRTAVLGLLALGMVAVLLKASPYNAASVLVGGRSNPYLTDRAAHDDMASYFDSLDQATNPLRAATKSEDQQVLLANQPAAVGKAADAEGKLDTQENPGSIDKERAQAESKAEKLSKQKELVAIDKNLAKEQSAVEKLSAERKRVEHQIAGTKQADSAKSQSLRIRVYPPGGGATSYAKSIKGVETKSAECLPPRVMVDGKCENYLKLPDDQKKAARELLRKNAYYKYKWSWENRRSGYKHHFRVVPKRYPHADGADLGDNYIGLDCGTPNCRYKVLEDKMKSGDTTYPKARIPKIFRPFTGDSLDLRFPKRPQKLKPGIAQANEGAIDKEIGGFFKSQKLGYQQYMEQFHPWDRIVRKPQRVDRFRPLSSSLYRRKNYPEGGGASRAGGGWKTPTYSSAVGGPVFTLHKGALRQAKLPTVQGPKTPEEKALLDGSDPLQTVGLFGDEERPAADVLAGKAQDAYKHKPEGEPLTDAGLNNWDMMNGVADP